MKAIAILHLNGRWRVRLYGEQWDFGLADEAEEFALDLGHARGVAMVLRYSDRGEIDQWWHLVPVAA